MSFAHLKPADRTKISRKGARTLHLLGRAHRFSSEKAKAAAEKRWAKQEKEK